MMFDILSIIPGKKKRTQSGWHSFNAVCCHHRGHKADKRGRGGIHVDGDNWSMHCFNCGFKTNYTPGRHLSYKFRKFLRWLGATEQEIRRLTIEAIRVKELVAPDQEIEPAEEVTFDPRSLPQEAKSITELATATIVASGNMI